MIKVNFGVDILGAYPVGSDYGHLKNLVNYAGGDFEYAVKLLTYVIKEWSKVKVSCFQAERMNVPTLSLVDTIKGDVHANIQTGQEFQPKPERKQRKGGRGVNRHQGGWDEWGKLFGQRNTKTD